VSENLAAGQGLEPRLRGPEPRELPIIRPRNVTGVRIAIPRKDTRTQVANLLEAGKTVAEIAAKLGISKPTVCYHKRKLGYPMDERFACRYDWPAVQRYYDAGHTLRECKGEFGFSSWAWTYAVRRGAIVPRPQSMPISELLSTGRKRNRKHIRLRLIAAGLKGNECERCGVTAWQGKPLSLELHHVNGDGLDNRLENLEVLCPNCHSQTSNWGGQAARGVVSSTAGRSTHRPKVAER
jgi:5-methylcytosine-specific restriction endonuclease McrA